MKTKRRRKKEYSKKVATVILAVAIFDIQACVLATFLDKEIPSEIAVALITEVIGIYLVYCLKAYFGKKAEEETRLKEEDIDLSEEQEGEMK